MGAFQNCSSNIMGPSAATRINSSLLQQRQFKSEAGPKRPFGTRRPKDITPAGFNISKRKNRTVQEALTNNNWVRDINLGAQLSVTHIQQFIILWNLVATIPVTPDADDNITWKLTQSGMYSVSSVYRAQFFGHTGRNPCPLIWKLWAPPKCKFFAWLVMRNRVWTLDRLATGGWPRNDCCPL